MPDHVRLSDDGFFLRPGSGRRLLYDTTGDRPRWILAAWADGTRPEILSILLSLDEGLGQLAEAVGTHAPFEVGLPCGHAFSRPGRIPAEDALAAYGYRMAGSVTGYAVAEVEDGTPSDDVRSRFAALVARRGAELVSIDAIGKDPARDRPGFCEWCCEISIPFEGPVTLRSATELVARVTADTGLEPTEEVELESRAPSAARSATIMLLARP